MRVETETAADLEVFLEDLKSWERHLRAANRSKETVRSYRESIKRAMAYWQEQGMPLVVAHIKREHCEAFLADHLATNKPATVALRRAALRLFFAWLVEEGEIKTTPMERVDAVTVPETPAPVLGTAQIKALFRACEGRDFRARRNDALMRFLFDTGVRRAECVGLKVDDLDLDQQVAYVVGKGSKPRVVPFGAKTAKALDRYIRVRRQEPFATLPNLWLTHLGGLSKNGLNDIMRSLCQEAGIPPALAHPHILRHSFAHTWRRSGGSTQDLMRLGGWKREDVMRRYGASMADEEAHENYRRGMSPGDRL